MPWKPKQRQKIEQFLGINEELADNERKRQLNIPNNFKIELKDSEDKIKFV